jgi:hypothetical protein
MPENLIQILHPKQLFVEGIKQQIVPIIEENFRDGFFE